jgi:mono/diheme cytochrome c family protein
MAVASGCFLSGDPGTVDSGPQLSALPCDVAQALSVCQACHGPTLAGGAPFTLVSYGDLTATSPTYSDQTVAQRALARMSDPNIPMPPHPLDGAAQSDIDAIQTWITAGYPAGSCTPPPGGVNPFDTPENACTSGKSTVTYGSELMYPGEACITCHTTNHGPTLDFAGTVYPTAHETDACSGVNVSGASIVVTDSTNKTVTVTPNSAGNFYSLIHITPPYTVKLTYQGRERDMTGLTTAATNGDCNSCHTMDGTNGAPGRIMLP